MTAVPQTPGSSGPPVLELPGLTVPSVAVQGKPAAGGHHYQPCGFAFCACCAVCALPSSHASHRTVAT